MQGVYGYYTMPNISCKQGFYPVICKVKWDATSLKRGNKLASRVINFYKAFIEGLNHQRSWIKLYTLQERVEKGFPWLF